MSSNTSDSTDPDITSIKIFIAKLLKEAAANREKKPTVVTNTAHVTSTTTRHTNSATETMTRTSGQNNVRISNPERRGLRRDRTPQNPSERNQGERRSRSLPEPESRNRNGQQVNIDPVNSILKRVAANRKIEVYSYKSRRQELLANNQPVCTYTPTTLHNWTQADYALSNRKFIEAKYQGLTARVENNTTRDNNTTITEASNVMLEDRKIEVLHVNIDAMKMFAKPYHRSDRWLLVVDTRVLLQDMFFITRILKSDTLVRLRLPYEVLHDLTAMTHKSQRLHLRIPARRVAQYMDNVMKKHILGQGAIEAEDLFDHPVSIDSVVNCCMQQMNLYYYVVLISDDPLRRQRARSIDLPCFTLQEAKELVKFHHPQIRDVQLRITRDLYPAVASTPRYNQTVFLLA